MEIERNPYPPGHQYKWQYHPGARVYLPDLTRETEGVIASGAVGVYWCRFVDCTFDGVGFGGPEYLFEWFRQSVESGQWIARVGH